MREQNVKWKMCGTRNPDFSRRKSFWSNQTLMRELSLFLSIDNFAKFDASCQLHLNPRKYQTWFSSCYSGWNKSISDGLRRHGDELRQENGVGEPLLQQRGLWTLRSGKGEKKLSSEGGIKNRLWLPGVLPRALARHDRRVLCFSSDRSGRLCRYPIPWGKTGFCFSFFVKMSAFVDVDGGLLMSSTRVGNAICSFDSLAGCC